MNTENTRRAERYNVNTSVLVNDTMTGQSIGRIGNISETGMLLMANVELVEDALYQLQFRPHEGAPAIDVGAHLLWLGQANTPGQWFAGLHFMTLSANHLAALNRWMHTLEVKPYSPA